MIEDKSSVVKLEGRTPADPQVGLADQAVAYWPTIQAHETGRSPEAHLAMRAGMEGGGRKTVTSLKVATDLWATATSHPRTHEPRDVDHGEQLANQVDTWIGWTPDAPAWPTPDGQVFQDGMYCTLEEWEERRRRLKAECKIPNGNGAGTPLAMAAHLWSTPTGKAGEDSQTHRSGDRTDELLLTGQAQAFMGHPPGEAPPSAWPTAGANDHKGSNRPGQRRGQLDEAGEHWATPVEPKGGGKVRGGGRGDEMLLPGQAESLCSLPAPATASDGGPSSPPTPTSPRPRLNPCFVAWLMGWPLTALGICGCSATASSPCKPPTPSCGCGTAWHRRMRSELERLVA